MTNKKSKKVVKSASAHPAPACECGCSGEKSCSCKCGAKAALVLGVSAVALILSVTALLKGPCPKSIETWVKDNPQVIADSLNNFYKKLEAERAAGQKVMKKAPAALIDQILKDKSNYSLGNPKGKFVIIEFFDYNCGWCKRTNAALKEALAKPEAKNIRWIPIDTPIFGADSERIARFVLAAGKQGKYAQMHDAVGDYKGRIDEAALVEIAKGVGLDVEKLKKDAESKEIQDKLVANREFTNALNIGGVPMLIVNGDIHPGALFGEELDKVVEQSSK